MSTPSAFDLLIKEINKSNYTSSEWKELINEKTLVILDVKRGEVLQKLPLWSVGKDIRTYIVSSEEQIEGEKVEVLIRDFDKDQSVNLVITYQASLIEGGESKLALGLMKKGNPDLVMRKKLESWTKAFSRTHRDFITNYFNLEGDFKAFLNKQAEDELGLELYPKINLSGVESIKDEVLQDELVKIFVQDSDEQYIIHFDAVIGGLNKGDKNYILAAPNTHLSRKRKEWIASSIADFLLHIPIQQIIEELSGSIQKNLMSQIDNKLTYHGRRLRKLSLRLDNRPSIKTEVFRVSHPFGEQRFKQPIQIISELRMKLVDKGKFDQEKRNQEIGELGTWVTGALGEIIDSELFYARYVELVLSFKGQTQMNDPLIVDIENKNYLGRIRKAFIIKAQEIGYEVQMLIIEPQLPEIKYTSEGFEVKPIEKEYATKTPEISLKIQFVITGKILNLKEIENLISEEIDITDRIRRQAEKIVSEIVHKLPPDDAILNFQQSIESPATEEIAKMLRKNFAVDDFSQNIIIKQARSDLKIRFDELGRGIHSTTIIIKPHYADARNEEFPYDLTYKIKGVHPEYWYTFQNNDLGSTQAEVDQINEILSGAIKSILEFNHQGEELALKTAIMRVMKQTGLMIDPFNFNAGKSLFEEISKDTYKAQLEEHSKKELVEYGKDLDRKYKQLEELEKRRSELLLGDEDEQEDLELIEARIKKIKAEIEKPMDTKPRHRQIEPGRTLNTDNLLDNVMNSSKMLGTSSNEEKDSES